jgi:hypothetical protein
VVIKASYGRLLDPTAIKHRLWAMNSTLKESSMTVPVTTIHENGRGREYRSDGFVSGTRSNNFSGADKPAKESDPLE